MFVDQLFIEGGESDLNFASQTEDMQFNLSSKSFSLQNYSNSIFWGVPKFASVN